MKPEEFIQQTKEKFGEQHTKDGRLIRDMNDKELLKMVLTRYPGERANIIGLENYLSEDEQKKLPPQTQAEKTLGERFKELGSRTAAKTAAGWTGAVTKAKKRVTEAAEEFSEAPDGSTLEGQIERTSALLKGGAGAAAAGVDAIFAPLTAVVQQVLESTGADKKISEIPAVQDIAKWAQENPEQAQILGDTFTIATAGLGQKIGAKALATDVGELSKSVGDEIGDTIMNVDARAGGIRFATPPEGTGGGITGKIADVIERAKLSSSKKNLNPQTAISAQRLQEKGGFEGVGAAKRPDLVKNYDKYFKQEQEFKADAKKDTAMGLVGEDIGKSFDAVIKMRQEVGKKMGDELKKIGGTKTNVEDTFKKFEADLFENESLVYDAQTGKLTPTTGQPRMTAEDIGLLEKFIADLNKLGTEPTIADLDAFMKRVPQELDVAKAAKNITTVTNGERLVKNYLAQLRKQFDPEATKNPALTDYYAARSAYSDLSSFVDEGIGYLGKKSQTGDYVKDASIAKSAVQSILNNGKKDWLIELENLTGYPALDESVLALQAMKDAGNFRGSSLLDLLSEEVDTIPTPTGITSRVLRWAYDKGADKFKGTPDEQTRRFLQALDEGEIEPD